VYVFVFSGCLQSHPLLPGVGIKRLDLCEQHGKQFEFYCVEDDIVCCSTGAIVQHRGCKVNEIATEVNEIAAEVSEIATEVNEIATEVNEIATEASEIATEVNEIATEASEIATEVNAAKDTNDTTLDVSSLLVNLDKSANIIIETLQKSKTSVGMVLQPLIKEIDEKKELVVKKFDYLRTYVTNEVTQNNISLLEEKTSKFENFEQKINASKDILNAVIGNRSEYQITMSGEEDDNDHNEW